MEQMLQAEVRTFTLQGVMLISLLLLPSVHWASMKESNKEMEACTVHFLLPPRRASLHHTGTQQPHSISTPPGTTTGRCRQS